MSPITRTLAALFALLAACTKPLEVPPTPTLVSDSKGVTLTTDAPQWKYVELSVAQEGPPLSPLPAPGHVDFDEKRTANVGSPLAGRVESVEVRLGDPVKKGDRLFSVRSGAFADLDRELETSRADVTAKERTLQRQRDLFALKAAPEKEVQAAEAELKAAELAFKAAQAKKQSLSVDSAGDNLFWVRAPRGGAVVDLDVVASQEVTPDRDKALVRISDLDEVLVMADMPETDVGDLKAGEAVHVRTQVGGVERDGKVDHISEVVDARRRTVEVRVRIDNRDRALRPNAFVEVSAISDASVRRLKVPDGAVVTDGNRSLVFVAKGPGRLEPTPVNPSRRRDGEVEIRSGLEAGTRFVSRGALLLLNQVDLAAN
ncbi:MAG: efflux RND transporter periplasmic adaptor subunit [Archangiaceae bacterium]|nr:efflux RND transporter periplasmic adaptor subunit [Archangiaceae bacterium]